MKKSAIAAGLIITAVALTACSAQSAGTPETGTAKYRLSATTPTPGGALKSFSWSLYAEPDSLAFPYAFDYPANTVLANVCDSLVRWNPDLTLSAGLATSWAAPTPTTWVYQIRPDVKFHDGTTMTADDVVASLSEHLDPAVGSYWASIYQHVVSIKKTAPLEVTVTSSAPDALFNNYMASAAGVVDSAATLKKDGSNYGNPSTGVNCSGPYSLTSWIPGQSINLSRFDGYWDKKLVAKSAAVKFVFLQDANTRTNAWTSGEVDGGWQVPGNVIDKLKTSKAGKVYFGVNSTVTSEIVGNLDGPLGSAAVRQALLTAIDRKGIVFAGEDGYAEVTSAIVPKSVWGGVPTATVNKAYSALDSYDYDIAAAKKLVEKAGVKGKTVVIVSSPLSAGADIVTQAVAAAATAIGLVPKIQTVSVDQYSALFSDATARKGIDLFMTDWYLSSPDPEEMFAGLQSDQSTNYGNWSIPGFDALVTSAIGDGNTASRAALSAQALKIVNTQLPWLPLYAKPTTLWMNNRITGVAPSIDFLYYPWAATIGASGK